MSINIPRDPMALAQFIQRHSSAPDPALLQAACDTRNAVYGKRVFMRGLIEMSSYCKNDCYYCGLRRGNPIQRYRLSTEDILSCCATGYTLGFHSLVLQSGEDMWFTQDRMTMLINRIHTAYPDCAITLSVGEKTSEEYTAFHAAGADRFLLRHETADATHYRHLHPPALTLANRKACLKAIQTAGMKTGAGFMVGSPGQTSAHLAADLLYLLELQPDMVGIGPFVPQHDTPFAQETPGTIQQTIFMVALTRLLLPHAMLPATTALGAICENGRELALQAGANVVMPNLSPQEHRAQYALYDNKPSSGAEAGEGLADLVARIRSVGLEPDFSRGDPWDPYDPWDPLV